MRTKIRVEEILVVHHTHTDWGFTTHQSVIEDIHLRFIDQAVQLCAPNADRPKHLRYRWTCESAWVTHRYLKRATPAKKRAFLRCVERGDIEVSGLPLHPTPLADARTVRSTLKILDEIRAEGIPVTVALGCDINGLIWPWSDELLDAGIDALAMAMNFTCGGGMKPWTAFHWETPRGRRLLCWSGAHYNAGEHWGLNNDIRDMTTSAPLRVKALRGLPYRKLLVQVTNMPTDNMPPHPRMLQDIARYNRLAQDNGWPRMRTSSLREWFDHLRAHQDEYPTYTGDWTDWWASGVATTPRATSALMAAQRRIAVAERRGLPPAQADEVRRKIFLAAEHTWGSCHSVESYRRCSEAGLASKQDLMYGALYAATGAMRASLPPGGVLFDPELEGFDPSWEGLVSKDAPSNEKAAAYSSAEKANWSRLVYPPRLILEKPADNARSTWFQNGDYRTPHSYGHWPKKPRWKRAPFKSPFTRIEKDGELHLEFRPTLPFSTDPRALYIEFPFRIGKADLFADVGGAWIDLRKKQIPGTCINWLTVHRGILISTRRESILWTPWDAPLVMFDAPCPGPPKRKNAFAPLVIVSWAVNNYWFTNFPGLIGGDYQFRYRLKHWPRRIGPEEAQAWCDENPEIDAIQIATPS